MAKIMIVDDYASVRYLYREVLTQLGHEIVAEADNGYDALVFYFECSPDLLIIEHHIKRINGSDVVRKIKNKDEHAKILMCVTNSEDIMEEAAELGVKAVILKPFTLECFIESVRRAVHN